MTTETRYVVVADGEVHRIQSGAALLALDEDVSFAKDHARLSSSRYNVFKVTQTHTFGTATCGSCGSPMAEQMELPL
jgi:hypothetical protein